MAAQNKKKKKRQPDGQGTYKRFLNDMKNTLSKLGVEDTHLNDFTPAQKKELFDYKYIISTPKKGNDEVTAAELKEFDRLFRASMYETHDDIAQFKYSAYDLLLLSIYLQVLSIFIQRDNKAGLASDSEVENAKELSSDAFHTYIQRHILYYYKVTTQKSYPDKKYYGIKIDTQTHYKRGNYKLEFITSLHSVPAQKSVIKIHGNRRPIFRLGKPVYEKIIEWISIPAEKLGNSYTGNSEEIDVYIQSHALQRMKERLDILDDDARNYTLWENTAVLLQIDRYKGFYLIPYKIMKIKVGYLVGKIIDDKFIITTFLFITHNSSPEGEKLKKISGLTTEEISYWKVDRLSAFVNLSKERYPVLMRLFEAAGMGSLKDLKNQKFDVETLQNANLDSFAKYVRKNKLYNETGK